MERLYHNYDKTIKNGLTNAIQLPPPVLEQMQWLMNHHTAME